MSEVIKKKVLVIPKKQAEAILGDFQKCADCEENNTSPAFQSSDKLKEK